MRTIAVLEVVNNSGTQLHGSRVAAQRTRTAYTTIAFVTDTTEVVNQSRLNLDGPGFFLAYVKVEVQASLE